MIKNILINHITKCSRRINSEAVLPSLNKKEFLFKNINTALLISYNGDKFYGLQFQTEYPTIEGCLINSIKNSSLILKEDALNNDALNLARGSRTDKGVHARTQFIKLKLRIRRRYADGTATTKEEQEKDFKHACNLINSNLPPSIRVFKMFQTIDSFYPRRDCLRRVYKYYIPYGLVFNGDFSDQNLKVFRQAIETFVGNKKFHNFTSGCDFYEKRARRIIKKIDVKIIDLQKDGSIYYINQSDYGPYVNQNYYRYWIEVTFDGESFMLHQIRKMIGIAWGVCKFTIPAYKIYNLFENCKIPTITAPQVGLYLHEMDFKKYSRRLVNSKSNKPELTISSLKEEELREFNRFTNEKIVKFIFEKEIIHNDFFHWQGKFIAYFANSAYFNCSKRLN